VVAGLLRVQWCSALLGGAKCNGRHADSGVRWLQSFLSADKRKTYCLYEAKSGDAIREAARRAGLPADIVIELAGELRPETLLAS
jgi:Protein of unknown function (DUF4242)